MPYSLPRMLRRTTGRGTRGKPTQAGGDRSLLNAATDFTYDGFFYLDGDVYKAGLTHRYVSGTLRLLSLQFRGNSTPTDENMYALAQYTVPGSYGGNVTADTVWTDEYFDVAGQGLTGNAMHHSIWWEEDNSRLWGSCAYDYPQGSVTNAETLTYSTRTLNPDGTAANHAGMWGIQGIGQRSNYGKVQKVPNWFKALHCPDQDYVSLSGGYSSLAGQGLGACYGPGFWFFPDPHGVYTGAPMLDPYNIPATDIKVGADCRAAVAATDWFGGGYASRTYDRGCRGTTGYVNWYDSSDNRSNPSSRPTYPTDWTASGDWWVGETGGAAGDDPDGFGRWGWGDSFWDTCNWIDNDAGTYTKHGILAVPSLLKGYGYYKTSSLSCDGKTAELHIYDPDDVAEVIAGTREEWNLRPSSFLDLTPLMPNFAAYNDPLVEYGHGSVHYGVGGATFDPTSGKLFVLVCGDDTSPTPQPRVYVFQGPVLA